MPPRDGLLGGIEAQGSNTQRSPSKLDAKEIFYSVMRKVVMSQLVFQKSNLMEKNV